MDNHYKSYWNTYTYKKIHRLYNISFDSKHTTGHQFYNNRVCIDITLIPKQISPITPKAVMASAIWYCNVNMSSHNLTDFCSFDENDLPVLKYSSEEYSFNQYTLDLCYEEFNKVIRMNETKINDTTYQGTEKETLWGLPF